MNAQETSTRLTDEGEVWSIGQLKPGWPHIFSGTIRKTRYTLAPPC